MLLKPQAKSVLISLELTAPASATDDIMKIIRSLEGSDLLIKGVSKKNLKRSKEQRSCISWNVVRHFRY